jgi:hypothetical protein
MKNSANVESDARGDHTRLRHATRRLLMGWAPLTSKLHGQEFSWRFEMKLTVFCLFVALTAGAQTTAEHLPQRTLRKLLMH